MTTVFNPANTLQHNNALQTGDVEILKQETGFKGFYQLDCISLRHRLFSGEMSRPISRELFIRPDAVCVLPYDPLTDKVIFIEQFRIGALEKSNNPWQLELVAGLIDKKNEQPEEVALREAKEEANLNLTGLWPITEYYPSVGGSNEYIHLYLGRCDSTQAGGIFGLQEEGEDIKTHIWHYDEAVANLKKGLIQNAASIIALQWLMLNKEEVKKQWL